MQKTTQPPPPPYTRIPSADETTESLGLPPPHARPPSISITAPNVDSTTTADAGTNLTQVKRNQSKYDFVKVRVWVEDHFYVLSRYLVCRALVSTKINSRDAVQISLELKKVSR